MNNFKAMRFERADGVATISFDNPANRNAFDTVLRDELAVAVDEVRRDPEIRALVLTGANGQFCSGGDLKGIAAAGMDGAGWRDRLLTMHHWLRDLILLDKPVIAAVDGAAFGAGFSLALAADFILATPKARFCMSFLRIGLLPDCGAFYTLPRKVGAQRARELMLSAREVSGEEALRIGIAMELHEAQHLLPRAQALARSFAGASPMAVSMIKHALADTGELARLLDAEANGQALAFGTEEYKSAVQRFIDKQPPAFSWAGPHPNPLPQAGEGARQKQEQ